MARRYFVTLVHVHPGDHVMTMQVGESLELPRDKKIECGRVGGMDIQCRGNGQGGRKCFSLTVEGDRVVIRHYRHSLPIWVRGKASWDDARLKPGDEFGPCEGIRFVVGVADDAPVLFDARRFGRFVAACPRPSSSMTHARVFAGFDVDDPDRHVVDVVVLPTPASRFAITGENEEVLHPAWPACIARFRAGSEDVRVGESTAGVTLDRIVERTQQLGATLDAGMIAWLVESIGRAMLAAKADCHRLGAQVIVRIDDGQPVVEPCGVIIDRDRASISGTGFVELLRESGAAALSERVTRACASVDAYDAKREAFEELLNALADARPDSGGDMRAAWHGLVHQLFADDVSAHGALVDELRMLRELPDADVS